MSLLARLLNRVFPVPKSLINTLTNQVIQESIESRRTEEKEDLRDLGKVLWLEHCKRSYRDWIDYHFRQEDREYVEHLTRYLQAKRDFPGLEIGPEPGSKDHFLRESVIREFNRTT